MVEGENALMDYGEDDWDCDAEEFEAESDSFKEKHFALELLIWWYAGMYSIIILRACPFPNL